NERLEATRQMAFGQARGRQAAHCEQRSLGYLPAPNSRSQARGGPGTIEAASRGSVEPASSEVAIVLFRRPVGVSLFLFACSGMVASIPTRSPSRFYPILNVHQKRP